MKYEEKNHFTEWKNIKICDEEEERGVLPPSARTQIALDFKHSSMLIEGFVKLYHLCQISDTPRHADCN